MIDVLPKPFTKEGLLSMLQKHLSKLVQPALGGESDNRGGSLDPSSVEVIITRDPVCLYDFVSFTYVKTFRSHEELNI